MYLARAQHSSSTTPLLTNKDDPCGKVLIIPFPLLLSSGVEFPGLPCTISTFTVHYETYINHCRTVGFSALYLCACSALKNNHDSITFEDVVTGYLTIFKLFYIDIRPLVKKGYANYRGFYYKNKKAGYPKRILWADYYSTEK